MLKNISVRTFIISFVTLTIFIINVMELLLSTEIDTIIYTDVVSLISILCLWWYMTKYLVEPINTVKKSIGKVRTSS